MRGRRERKKGKGGRERKKGNGKKKKGTYEKKSPKFIPDLGIRKKRVGKEKNKPQPPNRVFGGTKVTLEESPEFPMCDTEHVGMPSNKRKGKEEERIATKKKKKKHPS